MCSSVLPGGVKVGDNILSSFCFSSAHAYREQFLPLRRLLPPACAWSSVWAPLAALNSILVGLLELEPLAGMDSELMLMCKGLFLKPWMFAIILSVNTCFLLVKRKY